MLRVEQAHSPAFTGVEAPGSLQFLDAVDKSINGPCMGVIVNPTGAAGRAHDGVNDKIVIGVFV
jgi:hypothetical protein